MGEQLIVPDQLPTWVPGEVTVRSPDDAWDGVSVRGYRYRDSDVEVPAMRDFMVVAYHRGATDMRRRIDHGWHHEQLRPGDVSLLTRAADSHWRWDRPIEVVHVYLTHDQLASTCREMYGREVEEVELHDTIKADDPSIHRTAMAIAQEAAQGGVGSELLVDSLTTAMSVSILRRHANIVFRTPDSPERLTARQEHLVRDYVRSHLDRRLTLDELAGAVGLSKFHFARQFRGSTGTTPHEFVLRRRMERARLLLERTDTPLPEVASSCGFADQSHMNRVFRKRSGTTPGAVRRDR
ncbi:AraC family transcriptional regulator [Actinomycetospora termitidis]|uniref:AraC family transcriptional regulator n=1 Tax=Actinomycetospora termitidis TaxID=3053470 RepID=A0ABT7M389_9PSEU|nr:AraC family transcriptional regulator [Actinomycetospora sp. Odt1-22]MDL5155131.1 AraC family transcriptional regulator [Actinomycetospora sp. Odt1-22]